MTNNKLGNTQTDDPTMVRKDQKSGFIKNNTTSTIDGKVIQERQALSKILKPKADN